jgi:hypothetical protein
VAEAQAFRNLHSLPYLNIAHFILRIELVYQLVLPHDPKASALLFDDPNGKGDFTA